MRRESGGTSYQVAQIPRSIVSMMLEQPLGRAAVDLNRCSLDVVSSWRNQKQCRRRNVLRPAQAANSSLFRRLFRDLLDRFAFCLSLLLV